MNDPLNHKRLLSDILADGRDAGARDASLGATLKLVRRQRRFRQTRRAALVLAIVAVGAGLLWRQAPTAWHGRPSSKPYVLVRTPRSASVAFVATEPLPLTATVTSGRNATLVRTLPAGQPIQELNDEELLALAPNPAVLVRFGPHSAELVFTAPTGTGPD